MAGQGTPSAHCHNQFLNLIEGCVDASFSTVYTSPTLCILNMYIEHAVHDDRIRACRPQGTSLKKSSEHEKVMCSHHRLVKTI